jgi:hypothetical protein
MPRKSKRKRTESAPTKEPQAKPISIASAEFGKFIESQGGSVYLTALPGATDAGLPFVGIVSTPESLKGDLFLIEAGTALGKHESKMQRDPKARFEDRDNEIVRLKDELLPDGKQRSFGQVRQLVEATVNGQQCRMVSR